MAGLFILKLSHGILRISRNRHASGPQRKRAPKLAKLGARWKGRHGEQFAEEERELVEVKVREESERRK